MSGWTLSSVVVTGAGSSTSGGAATVNLAAGENVTIRYTNTKQGSITVIKDAVPDDPQDFGYTVTGTGLTPFSLDDDADPTLSNTQVFSGLWPGTYTITEGSVSGWTLTSVVVTGAGSFSTRGGHGHDQPGGGRERDDPLHQHQAGRITVIKDAVPDDPQDFSYTATGRD